jgi:hypothetical protein
MCHLLPFVHHGVESMIIRDLDALGSFVSPLEANSVLFIDPNTVLSPSFAAKCFQTVTWRYGERGPGHGGIQLI